MSNGSNVRSPPHNDQTKFQHVHPLLFPFNKIIDTQIRKTCQQQYSTEILIFNFPTNQKNCSVSFFRYVKTKAQTTPNFSGLFFFSCTTLKNSFHICYYSGELGTGSNANQQTLPLTRKPGFKIGVSFDVERVKKYKKNQYFKFENPNPNIPVTCSRFVIPHYPEW